MRAAIEGHGGARIEAIAGMGRTPVAAGDRSPRAAGVAGVICVDASMAPHAAGRSAASCSASWTPYPNWPASMPARSDALSAFWGLTSDAPRDRDVDFGAAGGRRRGGDARARRLVRRRSVASGRSSCRWTTSTTRTAQASVSSPAWPASRTSTAGRHRHRARAREARVRRRSALAKLRALSAQRSSSRALGPAETSSWRAPSSATRRTSSASPSGPAAAPRAARCTASRSRGSSGAGTPSVTRPACGRCPVERPDAAAPAGLQDALSTRLDARRGAGARARGVPEPSARRPDSRAVPP